jgi:hypothetical protein
MSSSSHLPWLHHSNFTWRRARITKLLVKQFSPPSRYFILIWSKYSPRHLVLKHPQSTFLLQCQRQSNTHTYTHTHNHRFIRSHS